MSNDAKEIPRIHSGGFSLAACRGGHWPSALCSGLTLVVDEQCSPLRYKNHPSDTTISFSSRPGFRRQVKSIAQKLLNTSRFRPR